MRRRTTVTEASRGAIGNAPSRRGSCRHALAVALLVVLSGCGRRFMPPPLADVPPATSGKPATVAQPGTWVPAPRPAGSESRPGGPPATLSDDPIAASPWAGDKKIEERVDWWVTFWQTRASDRFQRALVRMGRYEDFIDAEIASRGLPPSLRYLPVIEAGYYPLAVSPAGAGGLWQFMPATARWLGLGITPLVDQRLDPFAATPLALDFLAGLQKQFKSWFLALAAYNGGPGRVERAIREHGGGAPRDDDLFLRIRDRLPAETRDFIPKFLAAVRVASDPEAFGLGDFVKDAPWTFDEVMVEESVSIDVVAVVAGAPEEKVRDLNPHLVLGLTPAGGTTLVRLPKGSASGFGERLAAIPADQRVTFTTHRVAAGETLSHIARNYRISVAELRAANPEVEPRRMQIGTRLVVPRAGTRAAPGGGNSEERQADPPSTGSEHLHTVKRGDTLWLIARLYGVELERLLAHNEMTADATIQPGDEIRIPLDNR